MAAAAVVSPSTSTTNSKITTACSSTELLFKEGMGEGVEAVNTAVDADVKMSQQENEQPAPSTNKSPSNHNKGRATKKSTSSSKLPSRSRSGDGSTRTTTSKGGSVRKQSAKSTVASKTTSIEEHEQAKLTAQNEKEGGLNNQRHSDHATSMFLNNNNETDKGDRMAQSERISLSRETAATGTTSKSKGTTTTRRSRVKKTSSKTTSQAQQEDSTISDSKSSDPKMAQSERRSLNRRSSRRDTMATSERISLARGGPPKTTSGRRATSKTPRMRGSSKTPTSSSRGSSKTPSSRGSSKTPKARRSPHVTTRKSMVNPETSGQEGVQINNKPDRMAQSERMSLARNGSATATMADKSGKRRSRKSAATTSSSKEDIIGMAKSERIHLGRPSSDDDDNMSRSERISLSSTGNSTGPNLERRARRRKSLRDFSGQGLTPRNELGVRRRQSMSSLESTLLMNEGSNTQQSVGAQSHSRRSGSGRGDHSNRTGVSRTSRGSASTINNSQGSTSAKAKSIQQQQQQQQPPNTAMKRRPSLSIVSDSAGGHTTPEKSKNLRRAKTFDEGKMSSRMALQQQTPMSDDTSGGHSNASSSKRHSVRSNASRDIMMKRRGSNKSVMSCDSSRSRKTAAEIAAARRQAKQMAASERGSSHSQREANSSPRGDRQVHDQAADEEDLPPIVAQDQLDEDDSIVSTDDVEFYEEEHEEFAPQTQNEAPESKNDNNATPVPEQQERDEDDMGFPISLEPDGHSQAVEVDFAKVPDFSVRDFSFAGANFPLSGFGEIDLEIEEKGKDDDNDVSSKQNNNLAAVDTTATNKQTESTPGDGIWICHNCQEPLESKFEFCGMCGTPTNKQKTAETAQKPAVSLATSDNEHKRVGRKQPSSHEGHKVRRAKTAESIGPRRYASQGTASTGRNSKAVGREPPATPRRIKTHDGRVTKTPRSRGRAKVLSVPPPLQSNNEDDMLVVKCLDIEGGGAIDMDAMNQQFDTFDKPKNHNIAVPSTPSLRKKTSIRSIRSDMGGVVPGTPRSLTPKKKVLSRSLSAEENVSSSHSLKKGQVRQAIPRRAKSNTTDYLNQIKKNSGRDGEAEATGAVGIQSAHATGRPSLMRPGGLVKTASSRILEFAKSPKRIAAVAVLGGMQSISAASIFPGGKKNHLLVDSDDESGENDNDEFANDLGISSSNNKQTGIDDRNGNEELANALLVDFPGVSANVVTASPGASVDPTRTPRRRRRSVEARSRLHHQNSGESTPSGSRRLRSRRNSGAGVDYDAIDIDEGSIGEAMPVMDLATTPRRTRGRIRMGLARSEHTPAKLVTMTPGRMSARSRIRRASMTHMSGMPILDMEKVNNPSKQETTSMEMDASKNAAKSNFDKDALMTPRRRARRGSVSNIQGVNPSLTNIDLLADGNDETGGEQTNIAKADNNDAIPKQSIASRSTARQGRPRRRASIGSSDPLLQRAIAQLPEDPTFAVRGDIRQEWEKQEYLQDFRKKATMIKKQYSVGILSIQNENIQDDGDDSEESGADLELGSNEEHFSDLSEQSNT